MKRWVGVFVMTAWAMGAASVAGTIDRAQAALVTQLELTGGAVNWEGRHGRMLDRLFDQDGVIMTGHYQPLGQIVDPIMKGRKVYSLFTSNVTGAPAPSAVISGNSITVDLSSLFFGWQRGDEIRAWNIGGRATGLFNPETAEFSLSWEHLINRGNGEGHGAGLRDRTATFFLQGTAMIGAPAAVAIPASLFLYATGLFGVGSWSWWRRRGQAATAT